MNRFLVSTSFIETEGDQAQRRRAAFDKLFAVVLDSLPLSDSLKKAGIPEAEDVAEICEEQSSVLHKKDAEQAHTMAFIFAYTFDNGDPSSEEKAKNPYHILNKVLLECKTIPLNKTRYFIYGLLKALRSLPFEKYEILYRGINEKVSWQKGDIKVWSAFTSMTRSLEVTREFLLQKDGTASGTLINAKNLHGYDISCYSLVEKEEEVLIEPFQSVIVKGVIDAGGLVIPEVDDTGCSEYLLTDKLPFISSAVPATPVPQTAIPGPQPSPVPKPVSKPVSPVPKTQSSPVPYQDLLLKALELHRSGKHEEAVKLYEESGMKGSKLGWLNLGNCYISGKGVKKDVKQALDCWKKCGHIEDKDIGWMRELSNDRFLGVKELDLSSLFIREVPYYTYYG